MNSQMLGHLLAAFTMLVWGTTFIATKVLLADFTPLEILFTRFALGTAALFILLPRRLPHLTWQQESVLAGAGLCGVTLYFLLENMALTFTQVSNVGIILGSVPLFCALVDRIFGSKTPLPYSFIAGFACAMCGIALLSSSSLELNFNPLGDILALLASVVWGFYTLMVRKAGTFGCPMTLITRRVFTYGLIFMLPCTLVFDCSFKPQALMEPLNIANLLFLGLGASALCFFTWNYALKLIGTLQAVPYLYAAPVVTVGAAVMILGEVVTVRAAMGMVLAMLGLLLSQWPQCRQLLRHYREEHAIGRQ